MVDMLSEALAYARRGWYVFPCREKPGAPYLRNGETITPLEKTPYVSQGLNDATLDEDQIKAWWTKFPNALIGVNAGKSGLFVVDIDKKHVNGLDTFTQWNINDTAGLHSMTPSGGMHIVFTGIGKSSTNATTGIDTRGEGGYFIAPPSEILEGKYTGKYKTFDDWSRTPGIIPDGLMGKLFPDKTHEYVRGNALGTTGDKRQLSRSTLNFLANGALPGERNSTLFKVLADFSGCGYTPDEARDVVLPASIRIGLTKSEFEQVLGHAFSKPRTSSIPEPIQEQIREKIAFGGKNVATSITFEEQAVMEIAVIACMLVDNSSIGIVMDILYPDDFHVLKNRIIYKTIIRLYHNGVKVDYLTVANEISKETDKISMDDISKMMSKYFVNADNISTYADIIREKASIRKLESVMDNKEKYLKGGNLVEIIGNIEKDISDIALYGGVKSTNILTSYQAAEMVREQTNLIVTGKLEQLKTGFVDYDEALGGIYSNELIMLAGRAGEGKSALALSILNHVCFILKKPAVLFSLEMSTHESVCRLICQLTGIPYRKVYQGKMTPEEWKKYEEAMERIAKAPLHFDDGVNITVPELRSKIRKLKERDIKLVVIDQLEQIRGYEGQAEHIRFDRISYDIKSFTKEFDVPIILNHQLNRNITDRKLKNPEPQLSDLNQAGEKPANQVWIISHRKDEHGKIMQSRIKMLKNRNGARIDFPVRFIADRMLFSNPTSEEERYDFDDDFAGNGFSEDSEPGWAK